MSIDKADWCDWRWQLKNTIRTPKALQEVAHLTHAEEKGLAALANGSVLPLAITPYFASLIDFTNPDDPLRMQVVPRVDEFTAHVAERRDPLGEEDHEVVPHLVHRYPDRVLLLVTDRCASYCRFCTRKRWVGQGPTPRNEHLQAALVYIEEHPQIKEVIVSGGDALMLDDDRLAQLLSSIRQIKSVEIIRLATRMLTFAPMRVGDEFVAIVRQHQPVYVMSHINHPRELSAEAELAILKLVDAGIPVLNQTVLLKGVNDDAMTLATLFRHLTRLRARPYYLHQCDVVSGSAMFRVPLERSLQLVKELRGHISGLNVPQFIVDIPGGYGKVSMVPDPVVSRNEKFVSLEGFDGEVAQYPLD